MAARPPFLGHAQAREAVAGHHAFSRKLLDIIAQLQLLLAQFRRDPNPSVFYQVVTGLTTLQTAVTDLLRSYIKHTNSVLGSTPHGLDTLGISNPLGSDLLSGALRNVSPGDILAAPAPAATAGQEAAEPPKKGRKPKKEKKEKDPNEPKRPLTIFFLYSASARPVVKEDLGVEATKGQVEKEIQRRWNALPDEEKQVGSIFASSDQLH
ncbi:uncharacterized protein K452DRAFT_289365 [Aplosporella prunicola CBS 121167]|uniref:HMG box domain-containing protein n=1 Tax=Aplosporella prunicola CBS 121167 TaxID=1176127 RepID=A0A6A6B9S7_9PEZI|nr:uncharacterized protein K452DRAFT_289365 [Aplosporella prunicola CBS 121167]KAF2139984.1 hypothetical protein K452DRAFT_289365 [Aplosporella prunicola CBS 121167]